MKELAWDVGVGLRMDLSFFVIRFDVGFALYDPAFDEGERWIFNKINNDNYKVYKQPRGKEVGLYNFSLKDFVVVLFISSSSVSSGFLSSDSFFLSKNHENIYIFL